MNQIGSFLSRYCVNDVRLLLSLNIGSLNFLGDFFPLYRILVFYAIIIQATRPRALCLVKHSV